MKLLLAGLVLILIVETHAQWYDRPVEAAQGAYDMWRAYWDMRDANTINADKYFHARGNYDAANRGPGGRWAAEVISDGREWFQRAASGRGYEDTMADQEANRYGRNGGNLDRYWVDGIPEKYRRQQ
ncbi:serum amyloid protein A [Apostichopus japonicus]|uniref:Serum amyloid protein A n=1 Tax=Stichopus japonicus TaxID=307972 RepID=A0A2G8JR30_STIJA|nr:serum amyloid protein A [Apostichopus japonicus]